MSGGLGVFFAFLAAYYEWFARNGKTTLWILAALSFFYASYRVWAAERRRYLSFVSHKIIPHVIKESNAHLSDWYGMPAVSAILGLRFENVDTSEIAIKKITLRLCERWGRQIWELPLRGSDTKELHRKAVGWGLPSQNAWTFKDQPTPIEGLRIKPKDYSGEPYYLINDTMAFPDYGGTLENGRHFLRLTVEAVGQMPYMIDIEVDWTQPGGYILSAEQSSEPANTLRALRDAKEAPPQLQVFKRELRQNVREAFDRKRERENK